MAQFDLQITLEYGLVSASHPLQLVDEVNRIIGEGWQPLGGVFVYEDDLYQAIVREKKKSYTERVEEELKKWEAKQPKTDDYKEEREQDSPSR